MLTKSLSRSKNCRLCIQVVSLLLLAGLAGCAKPQRDALPIIQIQRQIQNFEVGLVAPGEGAGLNLIDRLNHHQVSKVSVAVVEDGELYWTRTWHASLEDETSKEQPDTFRADAILPALTVTAALRAVDEERLDDERLKQLASGDGNNGGNFGGNYEGIRQELEAAFGQPFASLLQTEILQPLEMTHTTLTGDHGLTTTSDDLAQWVIDLQKAHVGRPVRRLSRSSAAQMILPTDGNSLGLEIGGTGHSSWFARHGSSADTGVSIVGFVHAGYGAVVLATGPGHADLTHEIMAGLAKLNEWPVLPAMPKTPATPGSAPAGTSEEAVDDAGEAVEDTGALTGENQAP